MPTEEVYVTERTFDKEQFSLHPLPKGEYEDCHFINCDFSETDLGGSSFAGCTFTSCNLSMVKLAKTAFRDVHFKGCKMLGLHFETCNPFGMSMHFEDCQLDHSSFYQVKMPGTRFRKVQLREADLTEADLSGSVFDDCDLSGATFDHSNLEKADLRGARQYSIDPEINKIRKAKFSMPDVVGLLHKYGIVIS